MGKKSSKSKTTSKPWAPAQPYLLGAADTISSTVKAQQPMLNQLSQQVQSYLPGLAQKAFGADAGLDAAKSYNMDVLGGKYLGQGNPYLAGMIAQTGDNVMNRVNSLFGTAGRSLSGQHEGVVSRELANAENSLRYQDYGNERNAMAQAASAMPGITGAEVARVAPYLAATETAAQVPFAGIQNLGTIGSLFSGYGTQTSKQPGGWGTQLLSAAASAAPFLSDPSAKTKVEHIGDWDDRGDGLGKYRFAYKFQPDVMLEGVMADEVEALRPWALGPRMANGWRTVNYSKLSEAA